MLTEQNNTLGNWQYWCLICKFPDINFLFIVLVYIKAVKWTTQAFAVDTSEFESVCLVGVKADFRTLLCTNDPHQSNKSNSVKLTHVHSKTQV